jgi:hypothetical protein
VFEKATKLKPPIVSHKNLIIERKTLVHTDFGEIAKKCDPIALFIQAVKTIYYRIKISSCSDFQSILKEPTVLMSYHSMY